MVQTVLSKFHKICMLSIVGVCVCACVYVCVCDSFWNYYHIVIEVVFLILLYQPCFTYDSTRCI